MADKSALKNQVLFGDLTDAELTMMAEKVVTENYAKGKPIFKEGEPTKGLYLIRSGKVEISKATADGWKQTLAVFTENNLFGELSVIEDKKTHGADAMAREDTELFRISIEDFKALESSNTAVMYKIMKTIARIASRNVHTMNEKLLKALISY